MIGKPHVIPVTLERTVRVVRGVLVKSSLHLAPHNTRYCKKGETDNISRDLMLLTDHDRAPCRISAVEDHSEE